MYVRGDHGVDQTRADVTRLLGELGDGNQAAFDQLFPLIYEELHGLAHRQRRRWRGNHTLNTTALVHEAYVKLVDQTLAGIESRAHFFALAATVTRHILCNYARERGTRKRGGGLERLTLDDLQIPQEQHVLSGNESETLVALDEALRRLEQVDPRQGKVVECRFFAGLTIEETAAALGISARTVKRDWAVAQAWLHREMESTT